MPAEESKPEAAKPPSFQDLTLDRPAEHVLRITLNRPERRNSQTWDMIYELNDAFSFFAHDADAKVAILAAAGPDFNSGHDLSGKRAKKIGEYEPVGVWGQITAAGYEGPYSREREVYLDITERWRSVPKPTIAQVQGRCIAGGLMLAWACDLVVAADNASFRDTTVDMGVCGVETFAHPFELGFRKAKEFLYTADWMTADQARECGMVNRVVPADQLEAATLDMARAIARKPMFALKMSKEAINHAEDMAGRRSALMYGFALHQLCHAHNLRIGDFPITIDSLPPKVKAAAEEYARRSPYAVKNNEVA
ncbi:MAG TPA: enoyl-CoA hydratase [Caulobacterales bacterium]|nr:enoyl-CoA hydratase [Caulobacterales bacterium]